MPRGRLAGLAVAAILVVIRCTLPAGVFWTSDAGNKFLVAQNFAAGGYQHLAMAYPAAEIDPAFRWFPTGGEHFRKIGSGFYSIVSPAFPLINAPLVAMLGATGATLLPLLAGIGIAMLVPALVRASGSVADPAAAVLAVIFATPLAFYSLDFWEHTTATLLAMIAILFLLRERPLLAGIFCGASIVFREEGYVFLIAVLIASAMRRRVAAGAAIIVIPFWIAQAVAFGNPLGLHLAAHVGPDAIALPARLARNAWYFLFQFHERPVIAAVLAVAWIAAVLPLRRAFTPRLTLALLAAVTGAILLVTNGDPILNTIDTQGLFLFVPFVALLASPFRNDRISLLNRISLIYIILMPLVLRANWSGTIWGPRYFLTIMPLLVVAALEAMPRKGVARAIGIGLFVVSAGVELFGLKLLHDKLAASDAVRSAIAAGPRVVITDVFFVPEEMGSLYFEKEFLMPANDRQLAAAIGAIDGRGIRDFSFVTSARYRWYSDPARRALWRMAASRVALAPRNVPLLDLDIAHVTLPASRTAR
jgi:hypothetical protein